MTSPGPTQTTHSHLVFIDIDGTMTDGAARELLMEERGLVRGAYGDPSRSYPRGKSAFITAFNHPSMFHLDTTMVGAEAFISWCSNLDPDGLYYLTARDVVHHEAIRSDLDQRGLWVPGMRLLCKPHHGMDTLEFKIAMIQAITQAVQVRNIVYVENVQRLRAAAEDIDSDILTFASALDAVNALGEVCG